ncbi:MAG: LrgB family protein [Deferribacterales bacterium]
MYIVHIIFWSALTIALYHAGKLVNRRFHAWWSSPLMTAPILLIIVVLVFRVPYREYISSTHWMLAMLAPATVAFAIPIYEQRELIRKHWLILMGGVLVGSVTAMLSSWFLADMFGLSDQLRISLLPRSLSTPFALIVSGEIGGVPGLTAVFVIITGLFGATIGEILLKSLPLRSTIAKGSLFGMGAHAVGTAKAHQIDSEVGAISGLTMVLVGAVNVLAAPLVEALLR